uniref:Uncharacterized protein n=1 Tax=Aegilops tauschii subsp. strangulata TaxID=200361 RepID=A0A452XCK3_AEGTS
ASVQNQDDGAKVTPATPMKKPPQPKAIVGQQQQRVSADRDAKTKRPPKIKRLAEIIKKASDPAASFVDGDRAGFCSEEKMEAAKRTSSARVTRKQRTPNGGARRSWCRRPR